MTSSRSCAALAYRTNRGGSCRISPDVPCWLQAEVQYTAHLYPLYPSLRTPTKASVSFRRLRRQYPQLRATRRGVLFARRCLGLSDICRDGVTAADSVGRCRTSLRGGNRGPEKASRSLNRKGHWAGGQPRRRMGIAKTGDWHYFITMFRKK